MISSSAWLEVEPIFQSYRNLLEALNEQSISNPILEDDFMLVTFPLPYLQDDLVQNRYFQNKIAAIFQENLQAKVDLSLPYRLPQFSLQPQPLKIGYIAHNLRKHSLGWLSRWLFHYHNREAFTIGVYLVNQGEDDFTQTWFRNNAHFTHNLPPYAEAIATQIHHDDIDILVEIDSITYNIICQVMALKPAPIQVTWLGLDASGLPAIDYFIADPYVLPEEAEKHYQETIWRLPQTYLAVDGFEVDVPTLRRKNLDIPSEAIIYLSVQNCFNSHPDYVRLQMQILQAVPNSYLLIKGIADEQIIQQMCNQLAIEEGVTPDRLRFLHLDATEEIHRANLSIADVVLDTYPYNSATSTLEVLWQCIPIVTRVGQQFASRNSYAFMVNAGLTEGIAYTDAEYVEWGIKLGLDANLRQQVFTKLQLSRQESPLWNAKQFTRDLETAYQQMWEDRGK